MKHKLLLAIALMCSMATFAQKDYKPSEGNLKARQEFQDAKFGIFIHWGIYSMLADGEWIQLNRNINRTEYEELAKGFYPAQFNAKEWVEAFKDAGAKYVTITSRHHDGFSMFDTKQTNYDIIDATPFKRDILKELADACHQGGLKIGFYYSHMDWFRPDYRMGNTGKKYPHDESTTNWPAYFKFMNNQLTELLTNYGDIHTIWFDGMWDNHDFDWQLDEQYAHIHKLQPSCLIGNNHHRAVIPGEDIQIFEQDLPGGNSHGWGVGQDIASLPLESCVTMNNSWGYNIHDRNYKSVDDLIRYLVKAAGMNGNLLLNIGPRADGTLPIDALNRLKEMGKWTKKYGETIYGTRGGMISPREWGVTTQKGNKLYIHILKGNDKALALPIEGKMVKSAVMFDGKQPVTVTRTKDNVMLTLPVEPSGVDTIVEITLR